MNAVMEYEKYETNVLFFFISFDIFVFLDLGVIFFFLQWASAHWVHEQASKM